MANGNEQVTRSEDESRGDGVDNQIRMWVVSSGEDGCSHPAEERRYIGDDGKNTYYRCGGCGAALIVEGEIVNAARSLQRRSA